MAVAYSRQRQLALARESENARRRSVPLRRPLRAPTCSCPEPLVVRDELDGEPPRCGFCGKGLA